MYLKFVFLFIKILLKNKERLLKRSVRGIKIPLKRKKTKGINTLENDIEIFQKINNKKTVDYREKLCKMQS